MKRYISIIWIVLIGLVLFTRCEKDLPGPTNNNPPDTTGVPAHIRYVNNWIWDVMSEVYYWNNYLPQNTNPDTEPDPEEYFEKLKYVNDNFSWLDDDFEGLMRELEGVFVSMGYSPAFGRYSNTDGVFILVEYVHSGTPADRAGLKRGDIIVSINNIDLNDKNYLTLYNLTSYSVTLGEYIDEGISKTDVVLSMTAEEIILDPVFYYDIMEFGGQKVGYLVYVEFKSGENDRFLDSIDVVVDEFVAANVQDVIVDIRYNPGGDLTSAQYLASALAPASVVQNHEVLVRFDYNDLYHNYFLATEGSNSPHLVRLFPDNDHNLNLDRVYFLTSRGTASASEFLIIGLYPYMEVIQVGEPTYGKDAGAWVIPDLADPPEHNYALVPVVFKYANATGFTNFVNGLQPTYLVEDDLIGAKPFGSLKDPVLHKALEVIVGLDELPSLKSTPAKPPFERLEDNFTKKRQTFFINPW